MIRVLFSFVFAFYLNNACAQDRFVFIQNTDKRPFYILMKEKSYNSSSIGNLILPSLKDSVYNMTIGFPGSLSEQLFAVKINGRNRGFEYDGRQLSDFYTGAIITATAVERTTLTGIKKTDSYTVLMSNVVHDTAVLYFADTSRAGLVADSLKAVPVNNQLPQPGSRNMNDPRDIIRFATENINEGRLMIYLDRSIPVTDTIRLVIPRL